MASVACQRRSSRIISHTAARRIEAVSEMYSAVAKYPTSTPCVAKRSAASTAASRPSRRRMTATSSASVVSPIAIDSSRPPHRVGPTSTCVMPMT